MKNLLYKIYRITRIFLFDLWNLLHGWHRFDDRRPLMDVANEVLPIEEYILVYDDRGCPGDDQYIPNIFTYDPTYEFIFQGKVLYRGAWVTMGRNYPDVLGESLNYTHWRVYTPPKSWFWTKKRLEDIDEDNRKRGPYFRRNPERENCS